MDLHSVTITSHNTQKKPPEVFTQQHLLPNTILCLQEVSLAEAPLQEITHRLFPSATVFANTLGRAKGTAIIVHPTLAPYVTRISTPATQGHLTSSTLRLPNHTPIDVHCIYGSNLTSEQQYIQTLLQPLLPTNALLIGDFNATLAFSDAHSMRAPAKWNWLTRQTQTFKLHDLWRLQHPQARQYTRWATTTRPSASRLDMCLVTHPLLQNLTQFHTQILSHNRTSDHHPIRLTLPHLAPPPSPPIIHQRIHISHWSPQHTESLHTKLAPLTVQTLLHNINTAPSDHRKHNTQLTTILTDTRLALREILHQKPHELRPTKTEQTMTEARDTWLRTSPTTTNSPEWTRFQEAMKEHFAWQDTRTTKRLHRALANRKRVKRAIQESRSRYKNPALQLTDPDTGHPTPNNQHTSEVLAHTLPH